MSSRKWFLCAAALGLALGTLTGTLSADEPRPAAAGKEAPVADKPRVEVVFCLDTTGSMSGLIDAAKKKIWAISNQIASGKPTPLVKVGMVNYRDRGDVFVTKVYDLTDDLDSIYTHLMSFNADGGGDGPESVNQALHDAVHKITWSKDKKVLRLIFLVGDAPPHMDYPDDVKYPETCKEAVKRDIIINTVLCGGDPQAKDHWLKICRAAEGSFIQIDAGGGPVVAVATPFDKELAEINAKIVDTTLCFGDSDKQKRDSKLADAAGKLKGGDAADRIGYFSRFGGGSAFDLLQQVKEGKVELEKLKNEELPDLLKDKTVKEQKVILEKIDKERQALTSKALELDKKRSAFIAKKLSEDDTSRVRDSFDFQVLDLLRTQAGRIHVEYAVPPGKK